MAPSPSHMYSELLRGDFVAFVHRSFLDLNPQTPFKTAPHIELMASKLEACRRGETRRLIINVPPRNLKSHCVSIAFVAWLLGHNPALNIICASYGQDLADKLARDTRNIMMSSWYQALFEARIEGQAIYDFTTNGMGGRMATSVGGVLTGRGADFIILDDPLKPDDALSETQRSAVNNWFDNTLLSRLNDKAKGCIIIVMQRLHQEDLVGHVLEQDDWDVLSLPAIAETDETHLIAGPLGKRHWDRAAGEALHSERESLETWTNIRRQVGEYNFNSQYLQNPTPPGGAMVKTSWLKFYDPSDRPTRFAKIVQSWDTASKPEHLNDYSVCTTWGFHNRQCYLLDVFRERLNFPQLKRAVTALSERFRPHVILIEDKSSGIALIQDLQSERVHGVTAYKPPAGTDKIMRLHAQTAWFENGNVFLPRNAPWLPVFVAEITGFPGTKFDDQVDSTSQALDHMREPSGAEKWAAFGRTAPIALSRSLLA